MKPMNTDALVRSECDSGMTARRPTSAQPEFLARLAPGKLFCG